MQISLCSSCFQAVGKHLSDVEVDKSTEYYNCSLCFGLMDQQIYSSIIDEAKKEFLKEKFDGETFVLAVNFPVSQLLREKLIETIIGKEWSEQEMSPKSRSTFLMMNQFREDGFLRPSLHSDMILTVTFENDEFKNKDVDFFMCHQPTQFLKTGRKRQAENEEDISAMFTKVKVQNMVEVMSKDLIQKFNFGAPSKMPTFKVSFQRDQVFIAGRYCKYARGLPQTPWAPDKETPKMIGNSVSEKISKPLLEYFRADTTRFNSSGREDIDVRMLGTGRPFAVCLVNARRWAEMYKNERRSEVLQQLKAKINRENKEIEIIGDLKLATLEQMKELNIGQDAKKKTYTALCYSYFPINSEMAKKVEEAVPFDIKQWTPVRVLIRRPLMERTRTIHAARVDLIDDHYFLLHLETQAGTYVKEFVNGDFGRTRPSVANLMGFELNDGMSILELDVTGVDLVWPLTSSKIG